MLLPPALGSSPFLPVSVYGTGTDTAIAAFLGTHSFGFATFISLLSVSTFAWSLSPTPLLTFHRSFHSRLRSRICVPAFSVHPQHRILHLLSIGYASPPRLRSRLPQGRSALPWKPQVFGLEDSHFHLATHSGILSPYKSTTPLGMASALYRCSPTDSITTIPWLRRRVSAPCIFGAGPLG